MKNEEILGELYQKLSVTHRELADIYTKLAFVLNPESSNEDKKIEVQQCLIEAIDAKKQVEHAVTPPILLPKIPETNQLQPEQYEIIKDYFTACGLTIKSFGQLHNYPAIYKTLASLIADKYHNIKPYLQLMKQYQCNKTPFTMCLKEYKPSQISDIIQVAKTAYESGLLPFYEYKKSPDKELYCAPPEDPFAINFFNGTWLELFLYNEIKDIIEVLSDSVSIINACNIQIKDRKNKYHELDHVILVNKETVIWIEAKTGYGLSEFLPKYNNLGSILKVKESNAILINSMFEGNNSEIEDEIKKAGMTYCTLKNFKSQVKNIIMNLVEDSNLIFY